MIFKGDLSNFRPSDLFAFISNLEVQGLLTVMDGGEDIRIGFKDGAVVSTHCRRVDERILRLLYSRQIIDKAQFLNIRQIQVETRLSVREVLDNMKLGHLIRHKTLFEFSVYETVFHCFLMESGQYNFADIVVEQDVPSLSVDCRQMMHEVTRWVDEWREIMAEIGSIDRLVSVGTGVRSGEKQTALVNGILDLASRKPSIRQIIAMLPVSSLRSLKQIDQLIKKGSLALEKLPESPSALTSTKGAVRLFSEFKKTAKQLIFTQDVKFRLSALAGFCKEFFNGVWIFTVREGRVVQFAALSGTDHRKLQQSDVGSLDMALSEDRVFQVVAESNTAFFGKPFFSPLINAVRELTGMEMVKETGSEACAVIPVWGGKVSAVLLFVHGTPVADAPDPFSYLDILSWLLRIGSGAAASMPSMVMAETEKPEDTQTRNDLEGNGSGDGQSPGAVPRNRIVFSMDVVDTLPPMSHMISQILQVLSDPDSSITELSELVSMDPSLVAQLIKISNSALYKGFTEITSLKRALSRLGNKTVRSIVMISATKDLFPSGNVKIGQLGQALWRHSVECGLASRRVAIQTGYHDPEAAFTVGVLHDIGKLVILLKYPQGYQSVLSIQKEDQCSSIVAENLIFGVDHTQIGNVLMKKWNMPESLMQGVRLHHAPVAVNKSDPLPFIVGYGNALCHVFYAPKPEPSDTEKSPPQEKTVDDDIKTRFLEPLSISEAGHFVILSALEEEFKNADLFG